MKRAAILILMLILGVPALFSGSFYLQTEIESSLDTNIFSYPLVQNADAGYLEYRSGHPFFYRFDLGFGIKSNMFFKNDRVGLSLGANARFPLFSRSYVPSTGEAGWAEAAESGNWHYEKYDSLKSQMPYISFSIGSAFRFKPGRVSELGLAIRPSISSYDLFQSFEIGLQVDGFANFIFEENYYFTIGLSYEAHLMKFVRSLSEIYEENYFTLSVVPYLGFGLKLGD